MLKLLQRFSFFVLLVFVFLSWSVWAVEITPAQIQAFKSMSPEQQKQLAQQLGIDPNQLSALQNASDQQNDDQSSANNADPQGPTIPLRDIQSDDNGDNADSNNSLNGSARKKDAQRKNAWPLVDARSLSTESASVQVDDYFSVLPDELKILAVQRCISLQQTQQAAQKKTQNLNNQNDRQNQQNQNQNQNQNKGGSVAVLNNTQQNDAVQNNAYVNPLKTNNKDVDFCANLLEQYVSTLDKTKNTDQQENKYKSQDEPGKKIKLQPFGYDVFAGEPSTFIPAGKIPVPDNYVMGPGDTVIVQLYGKDNQTHEIKITREGMLQFPGIGPISVNGLDFAALRDQIQTEVAKRMIGVKVNVTMGALRSIQIFVLGEAYKPGAYTVNALSTMTNALLVSGGVKLTGSLRDIQLKRKGKVITHFDFYDLLLRGDTADDRRLMPGDVVFIPPIGRAAGVSGEVQRPAIYELKGATSVDQLIHLAGGLSANAYAKSARIDRVTKTGQHTFVDLNLASVTDRSKPLQNGDRIDVSAVLDQIDQAVLLSGYVNHPGGFAWHKGLRVSQVIRGVKNLKPDPDLNFAWLKRSAGDKRQTTYLRINLGEALTRSGGAADLILQPRDEIIVVGRAEDHRQVIDSAVDDLVESAPIGQYAKVINVQGNVRFPGIYPLTEKMKLIDLVAAAGHLKPESDLANVLLASRDAKTGFVRVRRFDLTQPTDQQKNLSAGDQLFIFGQYEARKKYLDPLIKTLQQQADKDRWQQVVRVEGSVRFPGDYPLIPNMAVQDLVSLAGGFTEGAYAENAEVTRDTVVDGDEHRVIHEGINLRDPGNKGLAYALQPKDQLVIKQISEWGKVKFVTVAGEFKYPGRYPISEGETLSQLVKRAGGVTAQGDLEAAVFLRKSLKEKEDILLHQIQQRAESDAQRIAADAASQGDSTPLGQAKSQAAKILQQIKVAESSGRLVVDVKAAATGDKKSDVFLRDGDTIAVPKFVQEVSVLGEVQFPTSHLYKKNSEPSDYISLSGGLTQFADKKRAYVIHKNGQVEPAVKHFMWIFSYESDAAPGDTVVVPVSVEISPVTYWASISQIVFQMATTVAALQTIGLFK